MAGITEEQGDKIIDVLEDILSELKDCSQHLGEIDSYLFTIKLDVHTIDGNVSEIKFKD
jgi:hypothetical protein